MKVWDDINCHYSCKIFQEKNKLMVWVYSVSQPNMKASLQAQVTADISYKMHLLLLHTQPVAVTYWKAGPWKARGDLGLSPRSQPPGHALLGKGEHFLLTWREKTHINQSRREIGCSSRAWSKCCVLRKLVQLFKGIEAQLKSPNDAGFVKSIRQVLSASHLTWL